MTFQKAQILLFFLASSRCGCLVGLPPPACKVLTLQIACPHALGTGLRMGRGSVVPIW